MAVTVISAAFVAVVLGIILAVGTSVRRRLRDVLPGAVFIAVLWQGLQSLGGLYVAHVIQKVSAMNGIFALVLGLFAFLYLAATIAVLGFEVNAAVTKRLYPRALLTLFTPRSTSRMCPGPASRMSEPRAALVRERDGETAASRGERTSS